MTRHEATKVRVLIVEDLLSDAELMLIALQTAGIECESLRVQTEREYLLALSTGIDIILADYSLPKFSALQALDLLAQHRIDVPLIVVTGTVDEEAAIECMKKGAADYLLKDRMARLGLAVQQALAAHRLRLDGQKAQENLRDLAKFTAEDPNPVMRVFANLRLAYANAASTPVLDAWGLRIGDTVPDDLAPTVERCLSAGIRREIEIECGNLVFAALVVPILESHYCSIYFRDITANRRADAALRASEQRLRLITDHVLDLVSQTTLDGEFLYVSPSHRAVLGYAPDALVARSMLDIVHPDHRQRVSEVVRAATSGRPDGRLELQARHANGHYVWLEAIGALLYDELGNPVGTVVSAREITQRKLLEADLQRRTEELERFNRLAVGRELRMIELKRQINDLSRRLGNPPPFATEPGLKGKTA
jgi:PAS domain S-box-containing protein